MAPPLPATAAGLAPDRVGLGVIDDRAGGAERFGYGRGWLVGSMPMVMQEDDLLSRFVTIFEEIASSVRYGVDRCDVVADVAVAPAPMVRYLGAWVGAQGATPELDATRQREIVRVTGATLAWRGTARGVRQLLEAVTGGPVSVSDGATVRRGDPDATATVGPVVVRLATSGHLRPDEVVAIVRDEVPAHLPITVLVAGELVAGEPADLHDREERS